MYLNRKTCYFIATNAKYVKKNQPSRRVMFLESNHRYGKELPVLKYLTFSHVDSPTLKASSRPDQVKSI